jgi:hypothetical protein
MNSKNTIYLAATVAFAMTAGLAVAQTSSSVTTTTQSIEPVPQPAQTSNVDTTIQHTVGRDGVVTDSSTTTTAGVAVSPAGGTVATKKTTETTTVR